MVILVSKQKRYWHPSEPVAVDDSISFDGQVLTTKTTVFRCIEIKVGSSLHCSWMDEEEGFFNPCFVTELHDNSITVTYEEGETSKSDLEYIRFPDKTIDEHTVDLGTNLASVFPEADAILQKQAEAKKKADVEKAQNAKKKALEAEEKIKQERKKALMETKAAEQETSKNAKPQEASKRLNAAMLALFFGVFGAHKFYLGYNSAGVMQIGLNCLCVGPIVGLGEAVIYLSMSDEDFVKTYQENTKEWF
jgi:TM2 domain-containing membrane protein YozV